MTKVHIGLALILAASLPVSADNIRLTTGKYLTGRVASYTNANFQIELENQGVTNLPASNVRTIDFENEMVNSIAELSVQASVNGKISLYDKGALSIENADGLVSRISLKMVTKVTFGNPVSAPPEAPKTAELPKKDGPSKTAAPLDRVTKIEEVSDSDLPRHVIRGKVTIVDFYADWCGPCRRIGPHLEELTQKNDSVILRRVNIDNNKELAAKFGISAIPNIIVYDKSGKNIGTVRGANPDGVDQLIAQATGRKLSGVSERYCVSFRFGLGTNAP